MAKLNWDKVGANTGKQNERYHHEPLGNSPKERKLKQQINEQLARDEQRKRERPARIRAMALIRANKAKRENSK